MTPSFDPSTLSVYVQPIRSLASLHATDVREPWSEVLLRGPFVSPEPFVAALYDAGLSVELDLAVLNLAVPRFRPGFHYSVNVSIASLAQRPFVSELLDLLHRFNVSPTHLVLELVERQRAESGDWAAALESIHYLRRHFGMAVAIDDIEPEEIYVHYAPFRYVKLSAAMTASMIRGEVPPSITGLLRYDDSPVDLVAEGVESAADLQQIKACLPRLAYWQGFHLNGRPAPFRPLAERAVAVNGRHYLAASR